jgi:deoxyhypusine monooxygenase
VKLTANRRFHSIDPAPPIPTAHSSLISSTSAQHEAAVPHLQKTLNDTSLPLFERYRAMFALRNLAGSPGDPVANQALAALCSGFSEPSSSLLKHEIAFVLGQLGSPDSAEKLIEILNEEGEEGMVRHEAAEALGGIDFTIKGDRAILKDGKEKSLREEIWDILQDYAGKEGVPDVVRESCIVARDMLKVPTIFSSICLSDTHYKYSMRTTQRNLNYLTR